MEGAQDKNQKRTNFIDWEEYFMATALLASERSKDPVTQVGACIVDENRIIIGVGYNGMPKGCDDDAFPWGKKSHSELENKFLYVCHAEMNAILNKNTSNAKGCTIYVTLFPCNECAKFIIQSGIEEVVYLSDKRHYKPETIAAKKMFDFIDIKYREFSPRRSSIVIDFGEMNSNSVSQLPATTNKNLNANSDLNGSSVGPTSSVGKLTITDITAVPT